MHREGDGGGGGGLVNLRHCLIKKTFVLSGARVCPTAWHQFLNGHYAKTATQLEILLGETRERGVYINSVHKSSEHLAIQGANSGNPMSAALTPPPSIDRPTRGHNMSCGRAGAHAATAAGQEKVTGGLLNSSNNRERVQSLLSPFHRDKQRGGNVKMLRCMFSDTSSQKIDHQ